MKRFILICFCFCAISTFAQNYDTQNVLCSQISDYLSRQGLNPENQPDGLKFKSEGATYYIEIDKSEVNPMYVRLCRYVKYDEKLNKKSIMQNLNSYNTQYAVKVYCIEKSVVISVEMFLSQASEFNYVFNTLLSQAKSAYRKLME